VLPFMFCNTNTPTGLKQNPWMTSLKRIYTDKPGYNDIRFMRHPGYAVRYSVVPNKNGIVNLNIT